MVSLLTPIKLCYTIETNKSKYNTSHIIARIILKLYRLWSLKKKKEEVQGLHAFAVSVLTVNDEHAKPRFKKKYRG